MVGGSVFKVKNVKQTCKRRVETVFETVSSVLESGFGLESVGKISLIAFKIIFFEESFSKIFKVHLSKRSTRKIS